MGSHTDRDELRSEHVATRLRPSERAELDSLASELDRPVASLIRDAIRAYLRRYREDHDDPKEVAK